MRRNAKSQSWGRLEPAGELPLAEFIDTFRENTTRRSWYLHDWSLPNSCPAAFGPAPYAGFTIPKYFAGDYFQRASFEGYQHSWPSLFIGANMTESALHIDSGGTNFWLHLLSGTKEWRFYSREDLVQLYQHPMGEAFSSDSFRPRFDRTPLMRYANTYEGIQQPGELIFIPGGNPHAVRNLGDIHGIATNYVDPSNIWQFLWLAASSRQWKRFETFADGVPHGMRSDQEALTFGAWKSTQWKSLNYDIREAP